jgi:acylglycerol lipase
MPELMSVLANEEKLERTDAPALFLRSWKASGTAKAIVVVVHGFNSHSGYYQWAAEQLTRSGLTVYAPDLRGRGKSDGERFYVNDIEEYSRDVNDAVKLAKCREPGLPVFVLGHSAGGVVSCIYTLEHQAELAGLICEDFAFEVYAPELALELLKGLSHVLPHTHVLALPNKDFTRDPKALEVMNHDPLIANESQSTNTVAAMARADERLRKDFPEIKLPVLIMHGTADKVTKPSGSQFFYDTAGSADKTLKLYDGHVHDLLNDLGKETAIADIQEWIVSHLRR